MAQVHQNNQEQFFDKVSSKLKYDEGTAMKRESPGNACCLLHIVGLISKNVRVDRRSLRLGQ